MCEMYIIFSELVLRPLGKAKVPFDEKQFRFKRMGRTDDRTGNDIRVKQNNNTDSIGH